MLRTLSNSISKNSPWIPTYLETFIRPWAKRRILWRWISRVWNWFSVWLCIRFCCFPLTKCNKSTITGSSATWQMGWHLRGACPSLINGFTSSHLIRLYSRWASTVSFCKGAIDSIKLKFAKYWSCIDQTTVALVVIQGWVTRYGYSGSLPGKFLSKKKEKLMKQGTMRFF